MVEISSIKDLKTSLISPKKKFVSCNFIVKTKSSVALSSLYCILISFRVYLLMSPLTKAVNLNVLG